MASTKFATGYFSTAADEVDNDEQLHQQMLESIIAQIETQARLVSEKYVELCQLVAAAKQLLTRKEFTKITEILGWSAAALNAYAKVGDAISCLAPSDVEHFDLGTIKNLANTKISSDVVESIEGGEKLTAQEVSERFKEARSLLPKKEKTPWVYIGSGNGSDDRAREFNVGRVSEEFGLEIEARMRETNLPARLVVEAALAQTRSSISTISAPVLHEVGSDLLTSAFDSLKVGDIAPTLDSYRLSGYRYQCWNYSSQTTPGAWHCCIVDLGSDINKDQAVVVEIFENCTSLQEQESYIQKAMFLNTQFTSASIPVDCIA